MLSRLSWENKKKFLSILSIFDYVITCECISEFFASIFECVSEILSFTLFLSLSLTKKMGNCFFARFPEHDFENENFSSSRRAHRKKKCLEWERRRFSFFLEWKMLEGYKQGENNMNEKNRLWNGKAKEKNLFSYHFQPVSQFSRVFISFWCFPFQLRFYGTDKFRSSFTGSNGHLVLNVKFLF